MKRPLQILIALLFAALSTGCDNGDIAVGDLGEIAFNAKHILRALDQEGMNSGKGKVFVYGVMNNNTQIYRGEQVSRDATTGKWFPTNNANKKNWVDGSSYSFYAYAYNTNSGLSFASGKDGLEIMVAQPSTYDESAMIDYLLSYTFKVADGAMKPIVPLYLEHAMALVEIYVVRGNMFEARLNKMTFENIYREGLMKCTSQAIVNSGERNVWQVIPSGTDDVKYTFAPTSLTMISDKRETTAAKMSIMCLPQQITANTKLTIEFEVNEKVTSGGDDNWVSHKEEFKLFNYNPVNYQSGHRIIYTATIDSGVNLEGVVTEWKDVDYIEGTVLPEIK